MNKTKAVLNRTLEQQKDISVKVVWHPTPVLLPGKSHGQRSLVGCRPWDREDLDTTERLHFHFSLSCIGEGNGNPLQCSCLENPTDRGAWRAAVHRVAQSWTRLSDLVGPPPPTAARVRASASSKNLKCLQAASLKSSQCA